MLTKVECTNCGRPTKQGLKCSYCGRAISKAAKPVKGAENFVEPKEPKKQPKPAAKKEAEKGAEKKEAGKGAGKAKVGRRRPSGKTFTAPLHLETHQTNSRCIEVKREIREEVEVGRASGVDTCML